MFPTMTASASDDSDVPTPTDLLALASRATEAYTRPDLTDRLRRVGERVERSASRVLVVGGFKAGKTELVNALLAGRALPTHDHRATTVPTVVAHAAAASVRLVRAPVPEGAAPAGDDESPEPSALAEHLTEAGNAGNAAGWSHAEIGLPRKLLAAGLTLVDTPGAGGISAPAALGTMAELPGADAVLLVTDAGRELTAPEVALLRTAAAVGGWVGVALTRIDLHPHWRRVAEIDRAHLAAVGLDAPVWPVSSALRLHALDTDDAALDAESGVAELAAALIGVGRRGARRRARLAADEVLAVGEQLAARFRAELEELAGAPGAGHDEQARAQERVAELRSRAARWQQTLNDGVADLVSDIEYDLRDRLRTVTTDAEEALDRTDPAKTWDQFAPWLAQQISAATATNFVWAGERTTWLAEHVAEHFAEDGRGVLPPLDLSGRAVDPVDLMAAPDHERFGLGQSLLVGMRGSYGGVLMVGMATTVAGMALLNPFSLGAGVLLGSKTLVDERRRAKRRRQMEAKNAVRRHVDDVVFAVSKNSKDMLREVQRTLRDHFTATAEELERSLGEHAAAALAARALDARGRERRVADAEAELRRIDALTRRAEALRRASGEDDGEQLAAPVARAS